VRNTSQVGEKTVAQVIAALVNLGKQVLFPFGDSKRYDLVIEEEDGRFFKVQCKTGRLVNGVILFPTSSFHAPSRTRLQRTIRRSYQGEVDFFGVYCPQTGKVYLVPVKDLGNNGAFLRVDPPKNNQQSRIRWAAPYEIGTIPQLGNNSDLSFPCSFGILSE
jgi:hypothetical protein